MEERKGKAGVALSVLNARFSSAVTEIVPLLDVNLYDSQAAFLTFRLLFALLKSTSEEPMVVGSVGVLRQQ